MKTHLSSIMLFFWLIISPLFASDLDYGLYFHSNLVQPQERTVLEIEEGNFLPLHDNLELSFNMQVRNEPLFGYVAHIKTDDGQTIDFVFAASEDFTIYPSLFVNEEGHFIKKILEKNVDIPVAIEFIVPDNKIRFNYDDESLTVPLFLNNTKNIQVTFGILFQEKLNDVAPVNIRDVKIAGNGKLVRHWELKQHNGDTCYDIINSVPAYTKNPYWLIDNHIQWKNIYATTEKVKTHIAFNAKEALFYLLTEDRLTVFNPIKNERNTVSIKGGFPAVTPSFHLMYDTINNNLSSYSLNSGIISQFSFETREWSRKNENRGDLYYNNHAFGFSPNDTTAYTFGGYGFYQYRNDLFKININSGEIDKLARLSTIIPRYSSTMAVVDTTLYIFGGAGNKAGKQEFLAPSYYDLYAVNTSTQEVSKIWEVKNDSVGMNFLMASSMYYNPSDSSFYAVSTERGGILMKIYLNKPGWKYISKPTSNFVPYLDMDFSFFYSPDHNRMFIVYNKVLNDFSYDVAIYSINLPLLEEGDIIQPDLSQRNSGSRKPFYIAFSILIAVLLLIFYCIKQRKKKQDKPEVENVPEALEEVVTFTPEPIQEVKKYFDRTRASISLLGAFNVRDKNGKDITTSFTPRLKSLLVLTLLYSLKNEQGILIKKLDNIIWEDKDDIAARNNRNVSLRKLRLLLDEVGQVTIVSDNGFLKIELGEDVFCDYSAALFYIKKIKQTNVDDNDTLYRLIEILLYGSLLPNTIEEWLDSFKDAYSSLSIDFLNNLLQVELQKQNPELCLRIADTIFLHDPLSEEALSAKCSILFKNGKMGLAKNAYEKYCKEYKNLLGTDYKISFNQICQED